MYKLKQISIQIIIRALPFLALFLVWWLFAASKIFPSYFIPSPVGVLQQFFHLLFNGKLLSYFGMSLGMAFLGLFIGSVIGLIFGIACGLNKYLALFWGPLVRFFYPIPTIVWVPLSLLWFGFSAKAIIFVISLGCFFCVFYNTFAGVANIPKSYKLAAKNLELSKFDYIYEVVLLGSMQHIITGLRLAFGQSWRIVVGAEMLASTVKGLGWFLWISTEFFKYEDVFVGMITIGIAGTVLEKLIFDTVEKNTILKWRQAQ